MTRIDNSWPAVALVQQATCAVKVAAPAVVAAPVSAPVEALSEIPAGRLPEEMDQTARNITTPAIGFFDQIKRIASKYLLLLVTLLLITAVAVFLLFYVPALLKNRKTP